LEQPFTENTLDGGDLAKKLLMDLDKLEFEQFVKGYSRITTESPVWSRPWIAQEIMLAEDVTVFYGFQSFNWRALLSIQVGLLFLSDKPRAPEYMRKIAHESMTGSSLIALSRRRTDRLGVKESLFDLFSMSGKVEVTDPRDRIYALLSMADDDLGIKPDYRENYTIRILLCAWVELHISRFKNLDILELASLRNFTLMVAVANQLVLNSNIEDLPLWAQELANSEVLPSWVPDLATPLAFPSPRHIDGTRPGYRAGLVKSDTFSRGGWLSLDAKLTLSGVKLDNVQEISEIEWNKSWLPDEYRDMFTKYMPRRGTRRYCNGEDMFDAYWRTLT
jgi:hypothetical protein